VVLEAMRAYAGHTGLQEKGCVALSNVGWSDPMLQQQIQENGGMVVVQAARAARQPLGQLHSAK